MTRAPIACLLIVAACAAPEDPVPDPGSYAAYNLFTGAPRFGVFKQDPDRDRCVRIVFLWVESSGTADLAAADSISVTERAADCEGAPPSLEPAGVAPDEATGTILVTEEGDAWTVEVDGVLTFGEDTEAVVSGTIEIQGGCC